MMEELKMWHVPLDRLDLRALEREWRNLKLTTPVTMEKVMDYSADLKRIAKDFEDAKCPKADEVQGDTAANGLPDSDDECKAIKRDMLYGNHGDNDKLTLNKVLKRVVKMVKVREGNTKSSAQGDNNNSGGGVMNVQGIQCYRCLGRGHVVADCDGEARPGWNEEYKPNTRGRGGSVRGGRGNGRGRGRGRGGSFMLAMSVAFLNNDKEKKKSKNKGRLGTAMIGPQHWIADCAVSGNHLCVSKESFCEYRELPNDQRQQVMPYEEGRAMEIEGYGTVKLPMTTGAILTLEEVSYAPTGAANLFNTRKAIRQLHRKGIHANFMHGMKRHGFLYLDVDTEKLNVMLEDFGVGE